MGFDFIMELKYELCDFTKSYKIAYFQKKSPELF